MFYLQKFDHSICSQSRDMVGRLKMREWKMRYGQNCKGGKYWSGNSRSRSHGWKMQEWKKQEQITGVENAGVSRMEHQTKIILKES